MSSTDVLEVIKSSVKINVGYLDKVIVVCSGRIEKAHVDSIKQFMTWLQFESYKQKFCFIYAKSDTLTEDLKAENLAHLCHVLGADPASAAIIQEGNGERFEIRMNLALGFPPGAEFAQIEADFEKLQNATLASYPEQRIPVDKSTCTIL